VLDGNGFGPLRAADLARAIAAPGFPSSSSVSSRNGGRGDSRFGRPEQTRAGACMAQRNLANVSLAGPSIHRSLGVGTRPGFEERGQHFFRQVTCTAG